MCLFYFKSTSGNNDLKLNVINKLILCKIFQKRRPLRKKFILSPVCTSETEDLEDVISDEESKLEESRRHAVTLQMVCKEIGNDVHCIVLLVPLNFSIHISVIGEFKGVSLGENLNTPVLQ